jgi:hypothetical protein
VLNQHNSLGGPITVTGGTFVNYNPALGDDNKKGNFVAEGYASVAEANGVWKVVKVEGTSVTAENFADAVKAGGTVILTENVNLENTLVATNGVTIYGQGHTISGSPVYLYNDATVNSLVFENAQEPIVTDDRTINPSGVYIEGDYASSVAFYGCTFRNNYWDSFQLTNPNLVSIVVDGCTFENTNEVYRNIHIELVKDDMPYNSATATATITNNTFINANKAKDSVITSTGILQENMTFSDNVVKGESTINSDVFWFATANIGGSGYTLYDWSFVAAGLSAE